MSLDESHMTLNDYQEYASETARYSGKMSREGLEYCVFGLAGEVGELCGKISKINRDGVIDFEKYIEELGDVLWFVQQTAAELGLNLSQLAKQNLVKLAIRLDNGTIHGNGDYR